MAVPILERVAARLQLARHQATVEDRLDARPPSVRFQARLHRGPWNADSRYPVGMLELSLPEGGDGSVRVQVRVGETSSAPLANTSIASAKLDAATLERFALELLEALVERG